MDRCRCNVDATGRTKELRIGPSHEILPWSNLLGVGDETMQAFNRHTTPPIWCVSH